MRPGDKVRILPDAESTTDPIFGWTEEMDNMIGAVCTLKSIIDRDSKHGWTIWNQNEDDSWAFADDSFVLYEPYTPLKKHRIGVK